MKLNGFTSVQAIFSNCLQPLPWLVTTTVEKIKYLWSVKRLLYIEVEHFYTEQKDLHEYLYKIMRLGISGERLS